MTLAQKVKVHQLFYYSKYEPLQLGEFSFNGKRHICFFNPEFANIPYIFLDFPIDLGKFEPIRAVSSVPLFGGSDTPFFLC
jgi:hypothetical protein